MLELVAFLAVQGLAHVAAAHGISLVAAGAGVALDTLFLVFQHLLVFELIFALLERRVEAHEMLPPGHLGDVTKDSARCIFSVAVERFESNVLRGHAITELGDHVGVETCFAQTSLGTVAEARNSKVPLSSLGARLAHLGHKWHGPLHLHRLGLVKVHVV